MELLEGAIARIGGWKMEEEEALGFADEVAEAIREWGTGPMRRVGLRGEMQEMGG